MLLAELLAILVPALAAGGLHIVAEPRAWRQGGPRQTVSALLRKSAKPRGSGKAGGERQEERVRETLTSDWDNGRLPRRFAMGDGPSGFPDGPPAPGFPEGAGGAIALSNRVR
eukprot:scaffold1650_cov155-Pinguiococcus_pyrenoidosus.AAC.2